MRDALGFGLEASRLVCHYFKKVLVYRSCLFFYFARRYAYSFFGATLMLVLPMEGALEQGGDGFYKRSIFSEP